MSYSQDWKGAPMRPVEFHTYSPVVTVKEDGTIYVTDRMPQPSYPTRVTDALEKYAKETPERVFIADRKGGNGWRTITYGEMLERVRRIAQYLLDKNLSAERPLAILSGNDIEHATLGLAAVYAGVAYAPLSPQYSLNGDYTRLKDVLASITPGMVYAADARAFAPAIKATVPDIPFIADEATEGAIPFADLLKTEPTDAVDAANAAITGDTIAKFLFTSGSTGTPKAVINTHRMICANQAAIRQAFSFMKTEPPVLLDWAPWNHTAAGNKNFYMVMTNGGTLYLDDGRPTKAEIGKTVRNLKEVSPTWYFNVPTGFDMLIPELQKDEELRQNFFRNLRMLWYAGASLSQPSWEALEQLAVDTTGGRVLIGAGLGATETAPAALFCTWPQEGAGNVGLPVPGVTLKLVPYEGKYDARVKGDNITPGYWRQPKLTADAFDEEGFYRLGDALLPIDVDDFSKGFKFDGRTAENFKLDTGTWVSTGALRMQIIDHFGELIRDVALTAPDKPYLGAIVFPRDPDLADDPALREKLREKLVSLAEKSSGSSNRVVRMIIAKEPPSMAAGEVTDKGSINQRAVLRNRADLVEEIYAGSDRVISV